MVDLAVSWICRDKIIGKLCRKGGRGGAVVAVAGRSLLVADASISVGSDICFIGWLEYKAMCLN